MASPSYPTRPNPITRGHKNYAISIDAEKTAMEQLESRMNDSQVSQEWKTLVPTVKRFLLTRATAEFMNRIKEEYRELQWTARDVNWLAQGIIAQVSARVSAEAADFATPGEDDYWE